MQTTLSTTLLIPNLHCFSCISHVEASLNQLRPRPLSVTCSILTYSVIVKHYVDLGVSKIAAAILSLGYELYDILPDPDAVAQLSRLDLEQLVSSPDFKSSVDYWELGNNDNDDEKKMLHLQVCLHCRDQKQSNEKLVALTSISPNHGLHLKKFRVMLELDGMTCSSCVHAVTDSLNVKSWSQSVNVNLITNSADIVFIAESGDIAASELVEAVENGGYKATIVSISEYKEESEAMTLQTKDLFYALFTIEGMTCASCVNSISSELKALSYVGKVEINLINNTAKVKFKGKDHVEALRETIEDIGFTAILETLTIADSESTKSVSREVAILVAGMHCHLCPSRVQEAVQSLEAVRTVKSMTLDDPVLVIEYTPRSPVFTIRSIFQKIAAIDESFSVSIYEKPSLEERSHRVRLRDRKRITYRVVLSIIAAIPCLIIGVIYMDLVSKSSIAYQYLDFRISGVSRAEWATFVMATPVYLFAADLFHRRTCKELKALWSSRSRVRLLQRFYRFGSMNMLISLGTTVAYFSSLAELIIAATTPSLSSSESRNFYFDSVVFLTMFLLAGRLMEAYMKAKTGDAVTALKNLRPAEAYLVHSQESSFEVDEKISAKFIDVGDVIRIANGASAPCDGLLINESAIFDESSLTGESKPVSKCAFDEIYSGTINNGRPVMIRTTDIMGESMIDSIMNVVREGQAKRAPVERMADAVTGYFVPCVVLFAVATWTIWLCLGTSGALPNDYRDIKTGGWAFWSLQFAIAVFVIACPCGLGLAAPTAIFVASGVAARHGVLVKGGGEAFEQASDIDCIVFDKTGTLTEGGEPSITEHVFSAPSGHAINLSLLITLLRHLEQCSTHPLAKAILAFTNPFPTTDLETIQVDEVAGKGMNGTFRHPTIPDHNIKVILGNESLMIDYACAVPLEIKTQVDQWKDDGKSIILCATQFAPVDQYTDEGNNDLDDSWILVAVLGASDEVRVSSAPTVKALQDRSIAVFMLSGDNLRTAITIGTAIGIPSSNIIADVLPTQKAKHIRRLQQSYPPRSSRKKRATIASKHQSIFNPLKI